MLKSVAIATIQRHLGFRSNLDAHILAQLQQAQSTFEREGVPIFLSGNIQTGTFLPWFLLTEIADIVVPIGEERIKLPGDFLSEWEESALWIYDSSADEGEEWKAVPKDDVKTARRTAKATDSTDAPLLYARSGDYFRLFPKPEEVTQFKMIYYAKDTELGATDIENDWLKYTPNLMMGEAGMHIASSTRDAQGVAIFENMRRSAARALFVRDEDSKHVNRRYVMGGVED